MAPSIERRRAGGRPPVRHPGRAARRPAGRGLLAGWCLVATVTLGHAAVIDMAEVRRLAQQPVPVVLHDTPFSTIDDADYRQKVEGSPRPVIVVFYADRDEKSRNLATLARYLALDFSDKITFFAYRASGADRVDGPTSERLERAYGIRQIPATLFYDNDRGKIELERTHYAVPTLTEYRTPGTFFFKTYYNAIHKYITEHILD